MSPDVSSALRELRDTLRQPLPSTEALTSSLSIVLSALDLHPTSIPPSSISNDTLKAIQRYVPAIQLSLLTSTLPSFLHALDQKELNLVDRFFCPPKSPAVGALRLAREIAAVSYSTLPSLLSTKKGGEGETTLPAPARDYTLRILGRLASTYGIDDLYWSIWAGGDGAEGSKDGGLRVLKWEEAVKAATSLPAKAANAVGRWRADGWKSDERTELIPKMYFERLASRLEGLMYELKSDTSSIDRIQLVVNRLAPVGLFSPSSNMGLMATLLPVILHHLHPPSPLTPYPPTYLPNIFLGLPTSLLNPFVSSLLANLSLHIRDADPAKPDERIKRAAEVLSNIVGPARVGGEAWDAVLRFALNPTSRNDAQTRIVVAWISASPISIQPFVDAVLATWTSLKHVKYALYTPQFQLTYTLILAISLLPPFHPLLVSTSSRPAFLHACQAYLSHPDGSVRRLGLLVAEMLSELTIVETAEGLEYDEKKETEELMQGLEIDEDTGKPKGGDGQKAPRGVKRLRFGGGMWDGEGDGREEARWLRSALGIKDLDAVLSEDGDWMLGWSLARLGQAAETTVSGVLAPAARGRTDKPRQAKPTSSKPKPKIVMLDADQCADPLLSYSPPHSPSSSRSPSPTPSYLAEIAADPSLALDATQKKKVTRPVYVPQLLQLLREKDNPDAIEMAMKHGEPLIRAKRGFGLELAENAVQLAGHLMGMSNQYGLDGWEEKRQGMVTALVACAPRQVAPFFAEQYFVNQHSLQQKSIILTALSMGARELAGLAVPDITTRRIDFPSRTLPAALHRKFISEADNHPSSLPSNNQIEAAAEGVRGRLLEKGARRAADVLPEVAREKRLRVAPSAKPGKGMAIAEVGSLRDRQLLERRQNEETALAERKTQTPVVAFSSIAAEYFIMPLVNRFWTHFQDDHVRENRALALGTRFRGAGAGMVLSPLALEKFLMTLALLVHAARNAPAFLAVLAPEVVELGLTVGSRHLHRPEMDVEDLEKGDDGSKAESQVIGSALELVLVALDISGEVDGGRTMMGDKMELVMAAGEWARGLFEVETEGGKVVGGQGGREGRIKGAAAGVVVRVAEMTEKWGRRR